MILFITTRPSSLDYTRRLRQFDTLGIACRHFCLSDRAFPQIVSPLRQGGVFRRLWALLRGAFRLRAQIEALGPDDILYCHALDSLVLTIFANMGLKPRRKMICQIMDVHDLLLYPGPYRAVLRRIERWALAHLDLLVVPSPGALPRYFYPVARFHGRTAVVNNTLPSGETADAEPPPPPFDGTWIIGWFGSLRCERSLKILCSTAGLLGPKVAIRIAGTIKLPPGILEDAISPYSNITYLGPFDAGRDAAALYRSVHFSYAMHFESPTRSQWALPVRMFEGGAYGRPALVRADTDAGDHVRQNNIGWAIPEALETELPRLLETLTDRAYRAMAASVRENRHCFIGEAQLAQAIAQVRAQT